MRLGRSHRPNASSRAARSSADGVGSRPSPSNPVAAEGPELVDSSSSGSVAASAGRAAAAVAAAGAGAFIRESAASLAVKSSVDGAAALSISPSAVSCAPTGVDDFRFLQPSLRKLPSRRCTRCFLLWFRARCGDEKDRQPEKSPTRVAWLGGIHPLISATDEGCWPSSGAPLLASSGRHRHGEAPCGNVHAVWSKAPGIWYSGLCSGTAGAGVPDHPGWPGAGGGRGGVG